MSLQRSSSYSYGGGTKTPTPGGHHHTSHHQHSSTLTSVNDLLLADGPPVWMEDTQSRDCVLCHKEFTLLMRRHHWSEHQFRNCGILVCSKCSTHRNAKSQRICDTCFSLKHQTNMFTPMDLAQMNDLSSPPTPQLHQHARSDSNSLKIPTPSGMSYSESPTPVTSYSQSLMNFPTSSLQSLEEDSVVGSNWMKDKESAECILCYRAFTLLLRRHHCRNCGALVCSKCSPHKIQLPGSKDPQRVCTTCYENHQAGAVMTVPANGGFTDQPAAAALSPSSSASTTSPQPSPIPHDDIISHAVLADPNLSLPSLPNWTYIFSKSTEIGPFVPIGRLYVRLICAVNLPAMNRIMSTTDPYCTLHCAGQSHKTRIVTNSLNPRFDQEFYFDILSAKEDQLTIIIWDWDQLGKNKEVAYLTIPLTDLSHSHRQLRWYEISNLSEAARKSGNVKDMNKDLLKAELKKKDHQLLVEAGHHHHGQHAEIRVARPRVQLELQYIYNDSGVLFSQILPQSDDQPSLSAQQNAELVNAEVFNPPPPFDVDILYSDLFRLLELLKPVTDVLMMIGPILFWTNPHLSFIVLMAFILCCFHPFMFLVILEVLALRGLYAAYVRRTAYENATKSSELSRAKAEHDALRALEKKKENNVLFRGLHGFKNLMTGEEDDAPAAINARSQSLLARLNPLTTAPDGKQLDAKDRSHMNGLVTHALNGLLITFGLHGNLAYYQAMLTGWCDMVENIGKMLNWENRATTKYITIGLVIVLIYSIFLPQKYLLLLAGGYVLTMYTPPSKRTIGVIMGVMQYMAIRKSRAAPLPTTIKRG